MCLQKLKQNQIIIAFALYLFTILIGCSEDEIIPLPPPKDIQHKVEKWKISISWTSVTGAVKYNIYRRIKLDEKPTLLDTVDKSFYEDTKATPGNVYFYQIEAISSIGAIGIISAKYQVPFPQDGKLQVSTELIDFGNLLDDNLPKSYDLKLKNVGGLDLTWKIDIKDDWILTDQKEGELNPQAEQAIHLTIKRLEEPKAYQGTLIFQTSANEVTQVVVKLLVGENPHIELNLQEILFQDTKQVYTLEIKNTGTGILTWKIQNSSDWLDLDKTEGQTGKETISKIQMTVKNAEKLQSDKTYAATVSITSNDINSPELTVKFSLYLPSLPPKLYVSDADKHLLFKPEKQSQTISIHNTGEGIMEWNVSKESVIPSWLTVNPQNGETKANNTNSINFAIDKEQGIPGKTLNAIIKIDAGLAGSETITIGFYTPEDLWSISPESLTLYSGNSENITISNIGEGSISWSAISSKPSWLKISNANGIIEAGKSASLKVTVDLSQEKVGTYTGEILLATKSGKSASIKILGYKIPDPILVTILDSHSKKLIQNLQIKVNNQNSTTFTLGNFKLNINQVGKFLLEVECNGYIAETFSGRIDEYGKSNPVEIYLRPIPHFTRYIEDPTNPFGSLSGICFSSDGFRAYASDERGSVIIIDAISDSVMYHVQLGGKPMGIIANPFNDELYIADSETNQVVILNTQSREIISRIDVGKYPQQLAISRDGKRLYVTCRNSRSVVLIDTMKRQTVDPPFLVGREPYGIALSPDERILYVANFGDNNVYLVDASNGQQLGSVSVSTHPQYLAVSKDYVYVSNSFGDQVSVIKQASEKLIKNIRIGNSILLSDLEVIKEPNNEDVIYVIDQTLNVLHPIDSVTMEMTKDEIPVGQYPVEMAIRPDLTKIYVTNSGSANISVLEF